MRGIRRSPAAASGSCEGLADRGSWGCFVRSGFVPAVEDTNG